VTLADLAEHTVVQDVADQHRFLAVLIYLVIVEVGGVFTERKHVTFERVQEFFDFGAELNLESAFGHDVEVLVDLVELVLEGGVLLGERVERAVDPERGFESGVHVDG